MTRRPPETREEQWEVLAQIAVDAEAHALASQTDEEVDADRRAHGLDPAEVDARGEAFLADLFAGGPAAREPSAPVRPNLRLVSTKPPPVEAQPAFLPESDHERPQRGRYARWSIVLVAATLATGGGILVGTRDDRPPPVPTPNHEQPAPPTAVARTTDEKEADERRVAAAVHCREHDYAACLTEYQAAAKLDPAGEDDPGVRALEAAAADAYRAALLEAGIPQKGPLDLKPPKGDKAPR